MMRPIALTLATVLLVGCQSTRPAPSATVATPAPSATVAAPAAPTGAAERLHEVSGSLLLFLASQHRLPATLDELRAVTGLSEASALDPATGQPFAYHADGYGELVGAGTIVLHAAHGQRPGEKWCVVVDRSGPADLARVVSLPADAVTSESAE